MSSVQTDIISERIRGHGGDIYGRKVKEDFSVNLSPCGISRAVKKAVRKSAGRADTYPDPACTKLRGILSKQTGVPGDRLIFGNGAAELFYMYVHSEKPERALLFAPCFSEYERALSAVSARIDFIYTKEGNGFVPEWSEVENKISHNTYDVVFLCTPANPSGEIIPFHTLCKVTDLCKEKGIKVVIDLCFLSFTDRMYARQVTDLVFSRSHIFSVFAFTKTYAMAGLRLGYGVCKDSRFLEKMEMQRQPWSVSVTAQEAGCAALSEKDRADRLTAVTRREREYMEAGLRKCGLKYVRSNANFLLFYGPADLKEKMLTKKILIRDCSNYRGLSKGWYRAAVKNRAANRRFLRALKQVL